MGRTELGAVEEAGVADGFTVLGTLGLGVLGAEGKLRWTEGGGIPTGPCPPVGSPAPSCRLDLGSRLYRRLGTAVEK